ncbi:hypothetical protein DSO57_1026833 [Entomophthora muscae]|uniref:Uncharacterized protein n=1 Tax=Entomophthora muscae TaxID=34485 RepID=A0ACC2S3T8_9FUNG|nr:hypothetical protein DSO57_1026833 [Entomophthora muscae]
MIGSWKPPKKGSLSSTLDRRCTWQGRGRSWLGGYEANRSVKEGGIDVWEAVRARFLMDGIGGKLYRGLFYVHANTTLGSYDVL